jgi:prepilin-type N-terminal cleavage/methylation domain-containing protein
MKRRAFTLVELVLAIFILGIGMISVAALFPAGMAQQQASDDEVYGPMVAKQAFELLRGRLKQEDFGTYEEFTPPGSTDVARDPVPVQKDSPNANGKPTTISGDWSWKRPGMVLKDDGSTPDVDEAGMVDVFSVLYTRKMSGRSVASIPSYSPNDLSTGDMLTELPGGLLYVADLKHRVYGIPYNRSKYDEQRDVSKVNYAWRIGVPGTAPPATGDGNDTRNTVFEPEVFVTQRERYWPMPSAGTGVVPAPSYVWDCMFRRFGGKVYMAVFVYRVGGLNGIRGGNATTGTPYTVAKVDNNLDPAFGTALGKLPAIPQLASSRGGSPGNLKRNNLQIPWGAGGLDGKVGKSSNPSLYGPGRDDSSVPGTEALVTSSDDPSVISLGYSDGWQSPGQWFIDFFGNVHRVLNGRRTKAEGPVTLAKPVPRQPYGNVLVDLSDRGATFSASLPTDESGVIATPKSGNDSVKGIQDIWFVPLQDRNGNDLTPIYAAIEEL